MTRSIDEAPPTASVEPDTADPLERLNLSPGHSAICGLQWGDEGKGQIVDLLTQRYDIVARYNGGANAGHSVQIGDEKYALHLIPSGILYPDKINVVGNGVVIDPQAMLTEIDELRRRGVAVGDNLKVSNRAHVVLPYHKVQDVLYDRAVAQAWESQPLGTTGRGIGPCYADKALRSTAVRMCDLLDADELRTKLRRIVMIKNAMLEALAKACGAEFEQFDAEAIFEQCSQQAERLRPHICDTSHLLSAAMRAGKHILFEGANAALLDIDHGTYPFVTSSSCSSLGIYPGSGVPGGTVSEVIGLVKLYTSRVGAGPFPTELHDELGNQLRERGSEYGTTTGRPRRCGWLDLTAVGYSARLCGATGLACTGLAVLAGVDRLKVCTGYRDAGRRLDAFPADAGVLTRVEPIFEEMEGFAEPVDTCRRYQQLPGAARAYIEFVEQHLGIPIRIVCVGKRRDQIIVKDA
jgi:adenylosuccinate synthase